MFFDDEDPGGTTYWLSQNQIVAPDPALATPVSTNPQAAARNQERRRPAAA